MAKLFLSHSSKDKPLANTVHAFLAERHHDLFLDHEPGDGIAPGADWERTLYDRLQWADAIVCLVTRNYIDSRWCFAEIALAKAQGRVILPLRVDDAAVHPLLSTIQQIACRGDMAAALDRLADRLAVIDAGGGIAWNPRRAVFPGLVAYDIDDRAMFFGREREVGDLLKEIRVRLQQRQPRAVVVVGASGSGKSSLVRAGLIPQLLDDSAWWRLEPILPGDAPLAALTDALARGRKEVSLAPDADAIAAQLPNGVANIAREILLAASGDRRRLLITVDQLEEIFTRASDADRRAFLTALATAVIESDGPVAIVATLRSEFVDELIRTPEARALRDHPFLLAPIGTEFLEDVITKPAQKAQLRLEPSLVRRLVADTGSGEALPLLAFTLARLVEGLQPGDRVGLDRYAAIGGVHGSVELQAEAALATVLTNDCTEADALATLMSFVALDDSGRPVRRRRRRSDLAPKTAAIVDAFAQARLLTIDTVDGVELVSVAHETLYTAWKKLADAITAAEGALRFRRDLERAAAEWNREHRWPSHHWRGERLARALRILERAADLTEIEKAFVDESAASAREAAERESAILANRVMSSDLLERDPELALLYLLAAVDEYAITPQAVAGLRRALAAQRLIARVGPVENRPLWATVSDDGQLMAIADLGTNAPVRPSTRAQPTVSAGEVNISLWKIGESRPQAHRALAGRHVSAMAWSRDGRILAVMVDTRVDVLDVATLRVVSHFDIRNEPTQSSSSDRRIDISPDGGRIEIDGDTERPQVYSFDGARWMRAPLSFAAASAPPLPKVRNPPTFTRLIDCLYAGLLLNITGRQVEVWSADPIDTSTRATLDEGAGAVWVDGPAAGEALAVSVDRQIRCVGPIPRIVDVVKKTEQALPWSFAIAAGFSADGRRVALVSRTDVGVFDIATNELVATLGHHTDEEGDTYTSVALNRDGSIVATGSLGGGRSHAWDVASGRQIRTIGGKWVGMSSDGALIASSIKGGGLSVHLNHGSIVTISEHSAQRFLFDPANSAVLAVARQGATLEFSLPDGSWVAEYPDNLDLIGFSADGRHVLGSIGDRIVRWPDRSPDAVIARARKAVYRTLTDAERDRFELRRPRRALLE
jgi:WD40 repeat protein